MIVFIDSGILGKLCNTNRTEETIAVNNWLFSLLQWFGQNLNVFKGYKAIKTVSIPSDNNLIQVSFRPNLIKKAKF